MSLYELLGIENSRLEVASDLYKGEGVYLSTGLLAYRPLTAYDPPYCLPLSLGLYPIPNTYTYTFYLILVFVFAFVFILILALIFIPRCPLPGA